MISTNEKIRFAGDVSVDNISVVTSRGMTQNITNQVIKVEIFEDLFSPFMSGIITVMESFDFINLLPFVGEEFVNINIHTPSLEQKDYIKQQFYIYKITDRIVSGDRTIFYQLHFVSREAIADVNKNISKPYSGLVSDIAKDLISNKEFGLESTKAVNSEPTANRTKFISNYWSPVRCLNYVTNAAQGKSGTADYVFYENRKGFNFVSLESLYNQPAFQEFVYDNYAKDVLSDGRAIFNLNEDYKRIIEYDVPVIADYLDKAKSGMYGSKIITTDPLSKKYYSKNYSMNLDYNNTYHLNPHAPVTTELIRSPNSLVFTSPRQYGTHNGYGDLSNVKFIQRRLSQMMQAQNTKINVTVLGRTDYTVGMKVKVLLYKMQPIKKSEANQDVLDTILSGYYIVSAINHSINREKHECTMELIKDSYIMNLNESK